MPGPARSMVLPAGRLRRRAARVLCAGLALLAAAVGGPVSAAPGDDLETAAIKSAFIYNFAKFTAWPPDRFRSPADPISFCVQRGDLDGQAVQPLGQKQVGDRFVHPQMIDPGASIADCHILFLSGIASIAAMNALLSSSRSRHVLLVSDMPGFAELGGHIALVQDRNKFRFQINLRAVQQTGLTLSSRLLQLAEIVTTGSD